MSKINEVLKQLKINGNCVNEKSVRHFSYYDIELAPGETVTKIERRAREIALALKSKTIPTVTVRSLQGVVRLQMAMKDADIVRVTDVTITKKGKIPITLGITSDGNQLVADFGDSPHTLVAGASGSGKSMLLHMVVRCIIGLNRAKYRNIDMHLIDTKGVEFTQYENVDVGNGIPIKVHKTYASAIDLLKNQVEVMDYRYNWMRMQNKRSIWDEGYYDANGDMYLEYPMMKQTIIIIDEASDLMMMDKKLGIFEDNLIKLAQKARAAGTHLVLASQRPSVDVFTGLIKANFPARIACKTSSRVDSQVILDVPGAETLMGKGDAIINSSEHDMVRFQGVLVE